MLLPMLYFAEYLSSICVPEARSLCLEFCHALVYPEIASQELHQKLPRNMNWTCTGDILPIASSRMNGSCISERSKWLGNFARISETIRKVATFMVKIFDMMLLNSEPSSDFSLSHIPSAAFLMRFEFSWRLCRMSIKRSFCASAAFLSFSSFATRWLWSLSSFWRAIFLKFY